jgi:transposase-like protein
MMRYSPAEKMEIIHMVEHSNLSIRQTLAELDLPRSTFYDWYRSVSPIGKAISSLNRVFIVS